MRQQIEEYFAGGIGEALRRDYPMLGPGSVVFDLGGYLGDWADDIHRKYGCHVHVFEPVERFAAHIARRFAGNPKVHVHAFGLGPKRERVRMSMAADGSSVSGADPDGDALIEPISAFMEEHGIGFVHLLKVNIEGAEYDLFDHLIETEQIERFGEVQVQFHKEVADSMARLMRIRGGLMRTHDQTWNFDFVFENWRVNPERCISREIGRRITASDAAAGLLREAFKEELKDERDEQQ